MEDFSQTPTRPQFVDPLSDSSTYSNTWTLLIRSIEKDEEDEVESYLYSLNTKDSSLDSSNRLLLSLLELASFNNAYSSGKVILRYFERFDHISIRNEGKIYNGHIIHGEYFPLLAKIFLLYPSEEILVYLRDTFGKITTTNELIYDLMEGDSLEEVPQAINLIVKYFGSLKVDEIDLLIERANDLFNTQIANHLFQMKREMSKRGKPSYIIGEEVYTMEQIFLSADEIVVEYQEKKKDPTAEDFVEGLTDLGFEVDLENFSKVLSTLKPEERKNIFLPLENERDELEKDDELFQLLGPSNPLSDEYIKDHVCFEYGGCRMLHCVHFLPETEEEDFDSERDWFDGYCESCATIIDKRCYALRIPLATGGWMGSYCSFPCLNNGRLEVEAVQNQMIRILEKDINRIGIVDQE